MHAKFYAKFAANKELLTVLKKLNTDEVTILEEVQIYCLPKVFIMLYYIIILMEFRLSKKIKVMFG